MQPTNVLLDAIPTLLAADTNTLAAVLALKVHLSKANFTPSASLTVTSFTEADFDGYAAKTPTAGTQLFYVDPVSGLRIVELVSPAGNYHFETTGVTNLPQTIFGYYVTDNASAILYGCGLLATPVPLTAINQGLDLPAMQFRFQANSPS